jgi:hypothetical protein
MAKKRTKRGNTRRAARPAPSTAPDASVSDANSVQRRAIPGFEGYYDITRRGDVYSRRLRRFIRQRERLEHDAAIAFTIRGKRHRLPLAPTVAEAYLSPQDREAILTDFPDLAALSAEELDQHPTVEALADHFNLDRAAIIAVVRGERQ